MRAIVVYEPGGPDVLRIEERPVPAARDGHVLVRVRAFGLNRGELMTRAGASGPAVVFPRVLGIECVGEVVDAGGAAFAPGDVIIAAVGGMGRAYDGGYQDYALLPQSQVIGVRTHLSWAELAAVPESFGTAWGSLATLDLRAGQTLLVHGGTSSVGMAAITLAKARGLRVVATTRQERKRATLEANGTDEVVVGTGAIANDVHRVAPDGVDGVLELVGPTAILDAFETLRPGGAVCMTGILEGTWDETHAREVASERGIAYHRFSSTSVINRDTYGSIFQSIVDDIERRRYRLNLDRRFAFDDIAEAHRYMEADRASGKVVVMT